VDPRCGARALRGRDSGGARPGLAIRAPLSPPARARTAPGRRDARALPCGHPMRLELHCHSTHSDGSLSAGEVAAMGAQFGVRLFCLTDHDTWGGHAETVAALAGTGCHVLRSAELTCKAYGRTVHLLVYGLQDGPGLAALASRLEWIQSERRARI